MKWKASIFALLLLPLYANAQGYMSTFGVNYASIGFVDSVDGETPETGNVILRMNGALHEYLSAELRIGHGVSSATETISGLNIDVETELEFFAGGYVRTHYRLGQFTPYVMVGFAGGKETIDIPTLVLPNLEGTSSFSGLSYAGGADIHMSDQWLLNLEFFHLSSEDEIDREGGSLGIAYQF